VAGKRLGKGRVVTASREDYEKLIPAAGAIIRAAITGDSWTAQRAIAPAEKAAGGYAYLAFLVARVAAALLVEACGSEAQAAALVNDWVNDNVNIRVRKAV
jgi:hypothetical protein